MISHFWVKIMWAHRLDKIPSENLLMTGSSNIQTRTMQNRGLPCKAWGFAYSFTTVLQCTWFHATLFVRPPHLAKECSFENELWVTRTVFSNSDSLHTAELCKVFNINFNTEYWISLYMILLSLFVTVATKNDWFCFFKNLRCDYLHWRNRNCTKLLCTLFQWCLLVNETVSSFLQKATIGSSNTGTVQFLVNIAELEQWAGFSHLAGLRFVKLCLRRQYNSGLVELIRKGRVWLQAFIPAK